MGLNLLLIAPIAFAFSVKVAPPPRAPQGQAAMGVSISKQKLIQIFNAQKSTFCSTKAILKCFKKGKPECLRLVDQQYGLCDKEITRKLPNQFATRELAKNFSQSYMGCVGGKIGEAITERKAKKLCR